MGMLIHNRHRENINTTKLEDVTPQVKVEEPKKTEKKTAKKEKAEK